MGGLLEGYFGGDHWVDGSPSAVYTEGRTKWTLSHRPSIKCGVEPHTHYYLLIVLAAAAAPAYHLRCIGRASPLVKAISGKSSS